MSMIIDDWSERLIKAKQHIESYEAEQQFQFVEEHREKLSYFLMLGRSIAIKEVVPSEEPLFVKNIDSTLISYFEERTLFVDTLDLLIQSGPKVRRGNSKRSSCSSFQNHA